MIPVDPNGRPIPVGRVRKELVETFFMGALPSWLTSDSGTVTFTAPTTSPGLVTIATAATAGTVANLKTAFTPLTSQFTQIAITIEGYLMNNDNTELKLVLGGTNCGAELFHGAGVANPPLGVVRVRNAGGNQDTSIQYRLRGSGLGPKKRNLTFMVRPRLKKAYVLEDDQVMVEVDMAAGWTDGVITPTVQVTTPLASSRSISIQQIRFSTESN